MEEVVKVRGDPRQSFACLDTLKVAQIIEVQIVLVGASNSFIIHEDMEQIETKNKGSLSIKALQCSLTSNTLTKFLMRASFSSPF